MVRGPIMVGQIGFEIYVPTRLDLAIGKATIDEIYVDEVNTPKR